MKLEKYFSYATILTTLMATGCSNLEQGSVLVDTEGPDPDITLNSKPLEPLPPSATPSLIEHVQPFGETAAPSPRAGTVAIDENGFLIDGKYTYLRGGTLQFFKIPEEEWADRLTSFKAAGFNTIDLYIAWNVHEPRSGEFDFETVNLPKFLQMVQDAGLYVYLRPGPYFTNEWDGGGLPGWLMDISTKDAIEADGKPNLRTADPDFLFYVERYFNELNEVVKPFLHTRGGPIILYSVENEYDYFETYFQVEKAFFKDGWPERPLFAELDVNAYLSGLRDIVLGDGIDVPIATCPGQAAVLGMGDTEGVIPMPNIYKPDQAEKRAYDIIASMHDPEQFGGAYVGMPSGSTETDRTATRMKRLFMGGLDGFFAFNVVSSAQEGRRNAIVMTPGPLNQNLFSWTFEDWSTAFVSPTVGYFPGVVDYNGAITPSGLRREKFYHFRRANLFFDLIEHTFGALERPQVAGAECSMATTTALTVENAALGAAQEEDQCHYFHRASDGSVLLSMVNETRRPQSLSARSVTLDRLSYPRYTTWTIPAESFPQEPGGGGIETFYAHLGLLHYPLNSGLELRYSTSEVLTRARLGHGDTLFLYGPEGREGELVLAQTGWVLEGHSENIKVEDGEAADELAFSYRYNEDQFITLRGPNGQTLRIVILTTKRAGRTWILDGQNPAALIGADFVSLDATQDRYVVEFPAELQELRVIAAEEVTLEGFTALPSDESRFGTHRYVYDDGLPVPTRTFDPSWDVSVVSQPGSGQEDWIYLGDESVNLEEVGIYTGSAVYRATVTIPEGASLRDYRGLYVESASDFVRISVNGTYVTTVAPIGTEIDNRSWNEDYRFSDLDGLLTYGQNIIEFEVTLWGHGSFMYPRGRTTVGTGKLPALGFDAIKGIYGEARLGNRPLRNWQVRPLPEARFETVQEQLGSGEGTTLDKGQALLLRTELSSEDLASITDFRAPSVLRLEGESLYGELRVDGVIIGRWLSDPEWLKQGSWVRPSRDMWMNTHPDDFPFAMKEDGHTVEILLRDMSSSDREGGGTLFNAGFRPAREHKRWKDGQTERVSPYWQRHAL